MASSKDDEIELSDVDEEGEEGDEEMEEYDDIDMGGLLTSLLTTEDGDNVCTAIVNVGAILNKHLETQNKILVKILAKLATPSA